MLNSSSMIHTDERHEAAVEPATNQRKPKHDVMNLSVILALTTVTTSADLPVASVACNRIDGATWLTGQLCCALMMSIRHESVTALRQLEEVIATDAPWDFQLGAEVIYTDASWRPGFAAEVCPTERTKTVCEAASVEETSAPKPRSPSRRRWVCCPCFMAILADCAV